MPQEHIPGKLNLTDMTERDKLTVYIESEEGLVAEVNGEREHDGAQWIDTDENKEQRANAARLALCWNTHDALVEALEWALPLLKKHDATGIVCQYSMATGTLREAKGETKG